MPPLRLIPNLVLVAFFSVSASGAPGDTDPLFEGALQPTGLNPSVVVAVLRPDRGILGGGNVEEIGGELTRKSFFLLGVDGALDTTLDPDLFGGPVSCVVALPDGSALVGGVFEDVGGDSDQDGLVRLLPDGSPDTSFDAPDGLSGINAIALLPDGAICVGGSFVDVAGDSSRDYLVRLHVDGALDTGFNPPTPNGVVNSIQPLPDGSLIVGGLFTNLGGDSTRDYLVRLDGEGLIDPPFVPPVMSDGVYTLLVRPDGSLLVGGGFVDVGGDPARDGLIGLDENGGLDVNFNPPTLNGLPFSIALQTDGRILLGGDFADVGGDPARDYVVRLESDGAVDTGFNTAVFEDSVESLQIDSLGRILVGGRFLNFDGDPNFDHLVRLGNDPVLEVMEVVDPSSVRWTRGGALQEASFVVFQLSTDGGMTWTELGQGSRSGSVWELAGLSLPDSGFVRGLALQSGGIFNGSSGFVESRTSYAFSAPVVSITGSKKITTSRGRWVLKGTARDTDGDLTRVEYRDSRESGRRWRETMGVSSWKAKIKLKLGRNVVRVRAYDERGDSSAVKKVIVTRR